MEAPTSLPHRAEQVRRARSRERRDAERAAQARDAQLAVFIDILATAARDTVARATAAQHRTLVG